MDYFNVPAISLTANKDYFKGPYLHQSWSLPDSIIYYISKNPKSSKCYQKLIQCCKYFFSKNPIIVCSDLNFYYGKKESEIEIEQDGKTKNIDLKNFSQSFWITYSLYISDCIVAKENVMSSLIPNIYQCDIKDLDLYNQIISFNELLFIASKVDYIHLSETTVKNDDGSVVPVEKIVEAFIRVKIFCFYNDPSISSKTFENLIKIPHFSTIDQIVFRQISHIFDIETFYVYMKKNKHTYFILDFNDSISDQYKARLEEIVDEILATQNRDYKPPMIDFNGLSFEQLDKLSSIAMKFISTTF